MRMHQKNGLRMMQKKRVRQTPTPNIKLKDADLFTDWKKFTDNSKMKQT